MILIAGPRHSVWDSLSGILYTGLRDQATDSMDILTVHCCEFEYVVTISCILHTKLIIIPPPTASMVLVSSNPTNLVISSASGINFIYFSGWTILPALLSALLLYPLLMFRYFRTTSPETPALVPRRLETPDVYPRGELKDVRGAIFKAALLAATLLALIVSSVLVKGLFVWWVTVPAALIAFTRDVAHDVKHGSVPEEFAEGEEKEGGSGAAQADLEMEDVSAAVNGARGSDEDELHDARWTLPRLVAKFASRLPTVYSVTTRLPWPLLPFAFSFFILVESLSSSGWISVWAGWMSKVVQNNDVVAIFFVGWICILLCNVSSRGIRLVRLCWLPS